MKRLLLFWTFLPFVLSAQINDFNTLLNLYSLNDEGFAKEMDTFKWIDMGINTYPVYTDPDDILVGTYLGKKFQSYDGTQEIEKYMIGKADKEGGLDEIGISLKANGALIKKMRNDIENHGFKYIEHERWYKREDLIGKDIFYVVVELKDDEILVRRFLGYKIL